MDFAEPLRSNRAKILELARVRGARNVRVFGSFARGDAHSGSDVDLLVDMERGRDLLDFGGLVADLEEVLGRRVDLVTERALHWYLRDRVVGEARPL